MTSFTRGTFAISSCDSVVTECNFLAGLFLPGRIFTIVSLHHCLAQAAAGQG
jgi:hypothetical protein